MLSVVKSRKQDSNKHIIFILAEHSLSRIVPETFVLSPLLLEFLCFFVAQLFVFTHGEVSPLTREHGSRTTAQAPESMCGVVLVVAVIIVI